jgi:hypothetical protein
LFSRLDNALQTGSPPRLPNFENSNKLALIIKNTLFDLYNNCFLDKANYVAKCGPLPMKLFIYNNNEKKMNLFFDSSENKNMSKNDFVKLIEVNFNTKIEDFEKNNGNKKNKRYSLNKTDELVIPNDEPKKSNKSKKIWNHSVPKYDVGPKKSETKGGFRTRKSLRNKKK